MASDFEDKKQRAYINRRSIMDLGMGLIYAGMGGAMVFAEKVGLGEFFTPPFNYIFGGICLIYGGFRIYRGLKRNYYR